MNVNEIIKRPILTEKTYSQMADKVYTFAVDPRVNKIQVKKAVEYIFDVKVAKVNIFNVPKQPTKLGKYHGFTNAYKKAIVKLVSGSINLYGEDEATNEETVVEEKKPRVREISDVEKRAAEKIQKKAKKEEE